MTSEEQALVDASAVCEAIRPHLETIDAERAKVAWNFARTNYLAAQDAYIAAKMKSEGVSE
jgi:hypothetical protein